MLDIDGYFVPESGAMAPMGWKGDWASSTAYAINDAVHYNGSSYIALVAMTAGNPVQPDSDPSKWSLMANSASPEIVFSAVSPFSFSGTPGEIAYYAATGLSPGPDTQQANVQTLAGVDCTVNALTVSSSNSSADMSVAFQVGGTSLVKTCSVGPASLNGSRCSVQIGQHINADDLIDYKVTSAASTPVSGRIRIAAACQ